MTLSRQNGDDKQRRSVLPRLSSNGKLNNKVCKRKHWVATCHLVSWCCLQITGNISKQAWNLWWRRLLRHCANTRTTAVDANSRSNGLVLLPGGFEIFHPLVFHLLGKQVFGETYTIIAKGNGVSTKCLSEQASWIKEDLFNNPNFIGVFSIRIENSDTAASPARPEFEDLPSTWHSSITRCDTFTH